LGRYSSIKRGSHGGIIHALLCQFDLSLQSLDVGELGVELVTRRIQSRFARMISLLELGETLPGDVAALQQSCRAFVLKASIFQLSQGLSNGRGGIGGNVLLGRAQTTPGKSLRQGSPTPF